MGGQALWIELAEPLEVRGLTGKPRLVRAIKTTPDDAAASRTRFAREADAILTLALRLVQRTVGRVEQRFVRSSVDTGQRSAHAERDERAAFASLPVHPQSSRCA